eukprot:3677979-Pyramimonas_sp.AAC.1
MQMTMPVASQRNTTIICTAEMSSRWATTCLPGSSGTDRGRNLTGPTGNSVVVGMLAGSRVLLAFRITFRTAENQRRHVLSLHEGGPAAGTI